MTATNAATTTNDAPFPAHPGKALAISVHRNGPNTLYTVLSRVEPNKHYITWRWVDDAGGVGVSDSCFVNHGYAQDFISHNVAL